MICVVVEHPYAGDVPANMAYFDRALADCYSRGEAPIASVPIGTRVLDDNIPEERRQGIAAGHAWIPKADLLAVYEDYGISPGMAAGIAVAAFHGVRIEYRRIMPSEDGAG